MFSETSTEVEYRVRVPTGTRRVEIAFALLDSTGSNLWRNEWSDYAAGGEARSIAGATLRVQPTFWSTPLLEGVLKGSVDPRECTFEVAASEGGETFVHISLAKSEPSAWGALLLDAPDALSGRETPSRAATTAQELVETMALQLSELPAQLQCARRCCELARRSGGAMQLVAAKALPQVAEAMRQHASSAEMQALGCAVLAALPIGLNALCQQAVHDSRLLSEAVAALGERGHASHGATRLHGVQALLAFAQAGGGAIDALVAADAVAPLAAALCAEGEPAPSFPPPPTRELALEALSLLARGNAAAQRAVARHGARALLQCVNHNHHQQQYGAHEHEQQQQQQQQQQQ